VEQKSLLCGELLPKLRQDVECEGQRDHDGKDDQTPGRLTDADPRPAAGIRQCWWL
jgi:hypothetical protein